MTPLTRNWRRCLPYIGGIAALLLFAAALVVLHSHAQAYRPSEVRRALRSLQAWQPFAALALTAASYLLLTLYDVLALRHVGRTLPYRRVALASFTGYAFSHTLGFGSLIGPSIRYRVYTPMGLTAGDWHGFPSRSPAQAGLGYIIMFASSAGETATVLAAIVLFFARGVATCTRRA